MLWTGLQNIFNHSGCECQNLMWIGLRMSESTLINYIRKMNSLSLLKENTLIMFGFLWDFYIYGSIMWLKELCGTMTNILSISFVSNTQGPICDAFYFLRIQNSSYWQVVYCLLMYFDNLFLFPVILNVIIFFLRHQHVHEVNLDPKSDYFHYFAVVEINIT